MVKVKMATTMLKVACYRGCSRRLAARSLSVTSHRFAQQATEEPLTSEGQNDTLASTLAPTETALEHSESPASDESDLYPAVRGKYPPGSSEDGTGWDGFEPKEAWQWHKQQRTVEKYSLNIVKKLSFLAKKPIKTWKFPSVQWGSGSLNYMGDRTKTQIIDDVDFLNLDFEYPDVSKQTETLAPILLDALRLENNVRRSKLEETFKIERANMHSEKYAVKTFENVKSNLKTKTILNKILSLPQASFGCHVGHLKPSQFFLDENVRVSAQWSRHGVQRHPPLKPMKRETKLPNNALFFGEHTVDFQLRTYHPLKEFLDREDPQCRECTYPKSPYKPTALGHRSVSMQRPVCPGFNLGAPHEFTHLNVVHTNERHLERAIKDYGNAEASITGYALATSFLSTVAMAHYQGFNMLSELTYPICTQTVVTDGQAFWFSAYQLNTLHMWRSDEGNDRQNLCWITGPFQLCDLSEDGRTIEGINEETLARLLKLVYKAPSEKTKAELSPLLPWKPEVGTINMKIAHKKKAKSVHQQRKVY